MSVVSIISLAHWVAAAVWNTQNDFKWLALGSFVMVGIAGGAYLGWQRWWQGKENYECATEYGSRIR